MLRSCLCALILFGCAFWAQAEPLNVRVLVASGARLELEIPFVHKMYYPDGRLLYQSETPVKWPLSVAPSGNVAVNGTDTLSGKIFIPDGGANASMSIGNQSYRGGMLILGSGKGLRLVNVVDIEDYLRSVVPAEMFSNWPLAALKAQAIVARTYAVLKINPTADYDLCATQECQVYPGMSKERPTTDQAVLETRGLVVVWDGKPARTYFSSDNGGWVASALEVWGMNVPYLFAQPDPFSKGPKSRWQLTLDGATLSRIVARYARVGQVDTLTIGRTSDSGRPLEIAVSGDQGKALIKGANVANFIYDLGGYSTRITLSKQGEAWILEGAGYGHGVGLSQYGAFEMAKQGYDALSILGFYFPKAQIGEYAVAVQDVQTEHAQVSACPWQGSAWILNFGCTAAHGSV
ncbi:MAG: SpoIID/LytB domain-containing protein [Deinococcaceae bacterium]